MVFRLTYAYVAIIVCVTTLIFIAHIHPGTSFYLPLLPSSYTTNYYTYTFPDPLEAENRHLTEEQCQERYPDLYLEADRAQEWFMAKGGISKKMVDGAEEEGNARLVILNNQVRNLKAIRYLWIAFGLLWDRRKLISHLVQQLFVKAYKGGINTRTQAAIAAVYGTILTATEPLPDVEWIVLL